MKHGFRILNPHRLSDITFQKWAISSFTHLSIPTVSLLICLLKRLYRDCSPKITLSHLFFDSVPDSHLFPQRIHHCPPCGPCVPFLWCTPHSIVQLPVYLSVLYMLGVPEGERPCVHLPCVPSAWYTGGRPDTMKK